MASASFQILLVEDEPVIRELVRTMLGTGEVDVHCVSSGTEALRVSRERTFDLVLLDIVLPGMDGITLLRLLRADPAHANAPIYMLTAKQKVTDVKAAMGAGATGYIHKPFKGADLLELVQRERRAKR